MENIKEVKVENKEKEKRSNEERDEERLEKLVTEPEQFEKKSLFTYDENNNIEISNEEIELNADMAEKEVIEEEVVDIDIKQKEENNEDFDVNFDETLLDEDDSDIEFNFEEESGNENKDLPKGVL